MVVADIVQEHSQDQIVAIGECDYTADIDVDLPVDGPVGGDGDIPVDDEIRIHIQEVVEEVDIAVYPLQRELGAGLGTVLVQIGVVTLTLQRWV